MFEFTKIFSAINDFRQQFEPMYWQYLNHQKMQIRVRPTCLNLSK